MADGDAYLLPVVAAALIDAEGRVLVQERPAGKQLAGLWEFPGGKIEPGESPEAALVRELAEELAIEVALADVAPFTFTSVRLGTRHLLLLLYMVRHWQGEPRPVEAPDLRWVTLPELAELPMPPADEPLVRALRDRPPG